MNEDDPFWYDEPSILYKRGRMIEFFPAKSMTHDEKLNALLRFSIYTAILVFLNVKSYTVFSLPLMACLITYSLHRIKKQKGISPVDTLSDDNEAAMKQIKEDDSRAKDERNVVDANGQVCQKPTKNNPYMNVLLTDYVDNPDRAPACDIESEEVREAINDNWVKNVYSDVDKIFRRNTLDRNWVVNPSTTIPNDRDTFARWVYGGQPSCKSDAEQCEPHSVYAGRSTIGTL